MVAGAATAIVEALAAALAGHAGLEVVSTATSDTDLFELIACRQVDGIVLYVPDLEAETTVVVNRLKLQDPTLRIVVLTAQTTPHTLAQAAGAGVAACLSLNAHLRDVALKPSGRRPPTPCSSMPRLCRHRRVVRGEEAENGRRITDPTRAGGPRPAG